MQRVAVVAGFAYHDRNTQLTIHPLYGCWHAYRAVVVVFGEDEAMGGIPLPPPPPQRMRKLITESQENLAKDAMEYALGLSQRDNLRRQLHKNVLGIHNKDEEEMAMAWISLREVVPLGQDYRYSNLQLFYHYTRDTKYILAAIDARRKQKETTETNKNAAPTFEKQSSGTESSDRSSGGNN